jgi:hypothetical protein
MPSIVVVQCFRNVLGCAKPSLYAKASRLIPAVPMEQYPALCGCELVIFSD